MRRKLLLATLLLTLMAAPLRATDLRGRIDDASSDPHPAPGVVVGLFVSANGSYTVVHQATTGPDGMYYFTGIAAGQYVLQVTGVNYPLSVVAAPAMQDIPTIRKAAAP